MSKLYNVKSFASHIMGKNPVLLIVDDEPLNVELLEAQLLPHGYDILKAENGEDALKITEENAVDLVLLDVMMPKIDGFEVCRRIKDNERLRNIPVVMITALSAKEDRIKGIEAGAEDFISKPFDKGEVLARVKMLLKLKTLNDQLNHAYEEINNMTNFGEATISAFDPLNFSFLPMVDKIVHQIIRKTPAAFDKPQMVVVGVPDELRGWQWYRYEYILNTLSRSYIIVDIQNIPAESTHSKIMICNKSDADPNSLDAYKSILDKLSIALSNVVCYRSDSLWIFAVNYGREVTPYDASVLNSFVMQSLFLKSFSGQIRETESAFEYTIYALARAAEVYDDDTGNHILRVGHYCALIAEQIGMTENAVAALRVQATLHDVGKVHVHPDILRKPGKLSPDEWGEVKKHPTFGATIIGNHLRLDLAKRLAATHHERWDGSGYPLGLRGQQILAEGRILSIADQYDALRNRRAYKPAFDHASAYKILVDGDGRTIPGHFDPDMLRVFRDQHRHFEEIYETRKD